MSDVVVGRLQMEELIVESFRLGKRGKGHRDRGNDGVVEVRLRCFL